MLIWVGLGIVSIFGYSRLGREQPLLVPPHVAHTVSHTPYVPSTAQDSGIPVYPREKLAAKRARIGGGLTLPTAPPFYGWDGKTIRNVSDPISAGSSTHSVQQQVQQRQRSSPQLRAAAPLQGDSVRCRHSGICARAAEGGCHSGPDKLGCIVAAPDRRERVRKAIKWSWRAYERCAFGQDELQPLSCEGGQWIGLGLTLVDALDTLILAEFHEVRLALKLLCTVVHWPCIRPGRRLPYVLLTP